MDSAADPIGAPQHEQAPYGDGVLASPRRVRTVHLHQAKQAGERFTMLTCYDAMLAQLFDQHGIDVLLVGDSAANVVLGESSTLPITLEQMILFTRAVARGASRAMVLADLPFGTYEASPEQAVGSAVRLLKEGGAHAVKIEAQAVQAPTVAAVVQAGVPVMGHVGFTPQSEHALGGYRVQGRGDAAQQVLADALALQEAGAFAVLLEMVPEQTAALVEQRLDVPTVGIGAGAATTGQVLVWQDMLGLTERPARFVKQYADLRPRVGDAVRAYAQEVRSGAFPDAERTY